MKIAILGGAFDPPHIGHYLVARQVKELFQMDEVWLMVCYSYFPEFPDKMERITKYDDRFKMATLLNENGELLVSDFESQFNPRSRTVDTLRLLRKHRPGDEFYWIIGSDTLPTFHLWNEWEYMVRHENIIVFPRDTDFITLEKRVLKAFRLDKLSPNITVAKGNLIVSNIASTHLRDRIKHKKPINHFVHPKVEHFITAHHLYE